LQETVAALRSENERLKQERADEKSMLLIELQSWQVRAKQAEARLQEMEQAANARGEEVMTAEEFWKEWSWNSATISIAVTDQIKKLVLDFAEAYAAERVQAGTPEDKK